MSMITETTREYKYSDPGNFVVTVTDSKYQTAQELDNGRFITKKKNVESKVRSETITTTQQIVTDDHNRKIVTERGIIEDDKVCDRITTYITPDCGGEYVSNIEVKFPDGLKRTESVEYTKDWKKKKATYSDTNGYTHISYFDNDERVVRSEDWEKGELKTVIRDKYSSINGRLLRVEVNGKVLYQSYHLYSEAKKLIYMSDIHYDADSRVVDTHESIYHPVYGSLLQNFVNGVCRQSNIYNHDGSIYQEEWYEDSGIVRKKYVYDNTGSCDIIPQSVKRKLSEGEHVCVTYNNDKVTMVEYVEEKRILSKNKYRERHRVYDMVTGTFIFNYVTKMEGVVTEESVFTGTINVDETNGKLRSSAKMLKRCGRETIDDENGGKTSIEVNIVRDNIDAIRTIEFLTKHDKNGYVTYSSVKTEIMTAE